MQQQVKNPFQQVDATQLASNATSMTRRKLLKICAAISATSLFSQSLHAGQSVEQRNGLLEPWLSIDAVQKQMFPKSVNWLSAEQINALGYLKQKLKRPLTDPEDYDFLVKGVGWLNDFAQSSHQQKFVHLSGQQKEGLLQQIAKSQAGENWLGMILNNLIEALLSDPIYGGNPNGIGWKAMGQTPGYPLPQAQERYFELGYQRRQRDYQQRVTRTTKG